VNIDWITGSKKLADTTPLGFCPPTKEPEAEIQRTGGSRVLLIAIGGLGALLYSHAIGFQKGLLYAYRENRYRSHRRA